MACKARTISDGSWRCDKCDIAGDRDEDPADFCKKADRGSYAGNRSPVDQEGLNARLEAHAAKNRERAKRR